MNSQERKIDPEDRYNHVNNDMLKKRLVVLNSELSKRNVEVEERDIYIQHLEQYVDQLKLSIVNENEAN